MHKNRRGFVIGGAAGLTAFLAPNAANACLCRRCRRAAAQQITAPLAVHSRAPMEMDKLSATFPCPVWANLTLPANGPLKPAPNQYQFTITGSGIYTAYVGFAQGAPTFILSIV